MFLISPVYQNTFHNMIYIEFYNLRVSFSSSTAVFNSLDFHSHCSFSFPQQQTLSWRGPNTAFYIAISLPTLLIKMLNTEGAIPPNRVWSFKYCHYRGLQTLSQFSLNRSILWLHMFKYNLNYLKWHVELANYLIMFKYNCHPIRKWFHNSIKTAIGFVRSNLFYRTHCLLEIIIPLAFRYLHFPSMFLTLGDGADVQLNRFMAVLLI